MPSPRVDLVVVSWNVRDELLACLESALHSTGVDLRCVVVDNASTDGSAEAVAAHFPAVHVIRNRANLGFARAVNQGLAAGTAPWVCLLNPDTLVPGDALARLVARLRQLPGHAAVAPRLVDGDGRPEHSAHLLPSLRLSVLLAIGGQRLLSPAQRSALLLEGHWDGEVERDVPWVVGAALVVRRSAIDRVGPLDESLFLYAEDLEWCQRLAAAGYRIRYVPDVVVTHLGNRSGRQLLGRRRTAAYLHNTVRVLRRRHGIAWTTAWTAVNGAAVLLRWGVASVRARRHPSAWAHHLEAYWADQTRFYLELPQRLLARRRQLRPALSLLVVGAHYPPHVLGGYELVCADWVHHRRRRGDDVTVVCSTYGLTPGAEAVERGPAGERVVRMLDWRWRAFRLLRPRGPQLWRSERRQWQALRRWHRLARPDVAVVWHMAAISKAVLAGVHRLGLPMVVVVGEPWPAWDVDTDPWCSFWDRPPQRLHSRLLKPILRRVAEYFVAPTGLREALAAALPVYASEHLRSEVEAVRFEWQGRGRVVAHGIDVAHWHRDRGDTAPLASPLHLLFVGRIEPRKGAHVAVEALGELRRRGHDARLLLVGWADESYLARLRTTAAELGVGDQMMVEPPLPRTALADVYRAADVLLFPTLWPEPFGLVPLEAMATGCLVVATGTGGSAEYLRHEGNCLLVPPGDAGATADAVLRLVADEELVARLRRGGRRTAADHDIGRLVAALDDIVAAAVDDRASTRGVHG